MLQQVWDFIILDVVGGIKWEFIPALFNNGRYYKLSDASLDHFKHLLAENHYVILTRRDTHLSTYLLSITELIMRRRLGYWSHCAMNAEDEVTTDDDFRIIEAIGKGVKYSEFMEVFDCDSASLLLPKGFTAEMWSIALLDAANQLGKKYDTVFDCLDDTKMSCIEIIRHALMAGSPNYAVEFARFEAMYKKYKKITPQMLYDCGDFVVAYEIRRK